MFKKAQAAMEFLMTYGWAILVVLIVRAALFYLGIFSPRTPNVCIAGAPISCPDVKATASSQVITLVLGASATQTATLDGVSISVPSVSGCTLSPSPYTISKATPTGIDCTFAPSTLTVGQKYSGNATVSYKLESSTQTHTLIVQFSGVVE